MVGLSDSQICKYAVLKCLSESEQLTFEKLETYTGFKSKKILFVLGKLIGWGEVKKIKNNKKNITYVISKSGHKKLSYFESKGYSEFWKPPWDNK